MDGNSYRLSTAGRNMAVGDFYEELCHALLGGERDMHATSSQVSDVHHLTLDASIEVKGTSNRDTPRIALSQLRNHIAAQFPCSASWYFIGSYRNHATAEMPCKGRRRKYDSQRLLTNKSYTNVKIEVFLREQTDFVCLVDATLLLQWSENHPTPQRRHGDRIETTLPFGRRHARELASHPELLPKKIEARTYEVRPSGIYEGMCFTLIALLPRKRLSQVESILMSRSTIRRI